MKKDWLDARCKRNLVFVLMMAVFAVFCVFKYFDHQINAQGTTVFAFSYKYGFISRGLLGTVWQVLDKIIPYNLMCFDAIYLLSKVVTVAWFLVMLWFIYICISRCEIKDEKNMKYLACFIAVFSFPMFLTWENFGRTDEYLMIMTVFCLILIVVEKYEWMVVPITAICVIMHHGYVFMYLNMILVLFFYKILMNETKRKKYVFLFSFTLLVGSIFFLYFEFFSHPEGANIYDEIVALSKVLAQDGESYSVSMVNHEILGLDVFEDEWVFHLFNYASTPFGLLFFMPYIIIGVSFLINLIKGKNVKEKWCYIAVALGALTTLPQFILKIDYGRYFFAVFFYYIAVVMSLIAMKDKNTINQLDYTIEKVKSIFPAPKLLIIYPILFMPFLDVEICDLITDLVDNIFAFF